MTIVNPIFTMAMPSAWKKVIRALAAKEQRSMIQMVRVLVIEALAARGVKYE